MRALLIATQIVVAVSVLNVWLLRPQLASPWRGGGARNLREEFNTYGLPEWAMTLVGAAKIAFALALLAGVLMPSLVQPAAFGLAALMAGAIWMHVKVTDPLHKSLPAAVFVDAGAGDRFGACPLIRSRSLHHCT